MKLPDNPFSVDWVDEESAIMSSSGISPSESCVGPMLGEDSAVPDAERDERFVGSNSISLSRT